MEGNVFKPNQPASIDFVLTGEPSDRQRAVALLTSGIPEAKLSGQAMLAALDLNLPPGAYRHETVGTRYYIRTRQSPSSPSH